MAMLLPRFKRHVADENLLSKGDHLVVAVSGGIDSMVLLDLLNRVAEPLDLELTVAHVNYGLRGVDSDNDEKLVRTTCKKLGIDYEVLRKKPSSKKNLQEDARNIRNLFFRQVADEYESQIIVTAHHMDDQVETILLHLIRGAGLKGLSGISPLQIIGGLKIVRPLLSFSKKELMDYSSKRRVKYREDGTNVETKYTRNAIRHRLIPIMEEFNPRIAQNLSALSQRLSDDNDLLDLLAHEALEDLLLLSGQDEVRVSRNEFIQLPISLRTRVLRAAFERLRGNAKDLNADQLIRMDHIAQSSKKTGSYRLPAKMSFERKGDSLAMRRLRTSCDRKG